MKSELIRTGTINEKRRFTRHPVNGWLLFFDTQCQIDMAQVVNISQGGVFCASLAEASCPLDTFDELELYDCHNHFSIEGLCGKILRSEYQDSVDKNSAIRCFTFGLEFLHITPAQLAMIEGIIPSLPPGKNQRA